MGKFKKGVSGNPKGKPKGAVNKSTDLARTAIAKFVDDNSDKFELWLDEIYKEHGAKEAFACVKDLIEYHVPKLSRQELKHEGEVTLNKILAKLDDPDEE